MPNYEQTRPCFSQTSVLHDSTTLSTPCTVLLAQLRRADIDPGSDFSECSPLQVIVRPIMAVQDSNPCQFMVVLAAACYQPLA